VNLFVRLGSCLQSGVIPMPLQRPQAIDIPAWSGYAVRRRIAAMLRFPLHNAALDLQGKLPEELPRGLLTIPPEVREIVAGQLARYPPEARAPHEAGRLCFETVGWFFYDLEVPVVYRETPEGPDVLAVGREEVAAYLNKTSQDGRPADVKVYRGFL
jgi:hypothetical protein